jgi:hypothetical protein
MQRSQVNCYLYLGGRGTLVRAGRMAAGERQNQDGLLRRVSLEKAEGEECRM